MAAAAPMSVVEGLPFAEEKKRYIVDVLDPVLEEMVSDVLTEMPKSPRGFMIEWLRKRYGGYAKPRMSVIGKNDFLKNEMTKATTSLQEMGMTITGERENAEEEEEEDDDDDCDELPESFRKPESQMAGGRASVSAEAYGNWNQKKAFTPPTYPKTEEQTARLSATLTKSFMFSELDKPDMETILLAMKECQFKSGEKVITEGENGDYLFVIEQGALDCIKVIDGQEKVVKTCARSDVFGELALLYNGPRAANVVAKDDCVCWQLDRETFNHIVKESAVKRREKYDKFLQSVALISTLGAYERSQIADALKPEFYNRGDYIVRQDEPGDKFYILEEGDLYATKSSLLQPEKRVMEYQPGDYFGELALLKNQPRAASVVVSSERAKVLSMSRVSFTRLLGSLQGILTSQSASYG